MSRADIIPRDLFIAEGRRLSVYFYTSNVAKFLQANLIFQRAGLPLRQFVSRTVPYFEDYGGSSENLLQRAVSEVTSYVGHASLVFIEDTTVRIDALSTVDHDFPGLETKEWFERTSFEALDEQLSILGRGRTCVVKSDVALHIPGLVKPVILHGETTGTIADTVPEFLPHPIYPWLTPATFNGWFIPTGATLRLGEMELEESFEYDFRAKSLISLLDRLEELSAALNLPPRAYTRQEAPNENAPLPLFPRPIYLLVGPTCAGKTTAALFLQGTRRWGMIEASAVMRKLGMRLSLEHLQPAEMARRVVQELGRDAVAREILKLLMADTEYAISGFRFVEELELFRAQFPGRVRMVYINAPASERLARMIARQRTGDAVMSLSDLAARDIEQEQFGLIPFARTFSDYIVDNVGTKEDLYQRLDAIGQEPPSIRLRPAFTDSLESDQGLRCLKVLAQERRPMSTDEISSITGRFGKSIRHNNVNKVLKRLIGLVKTNRRTGATREVRDPSRGLFIRAVCARCIDILIGFREATFSH